MIDCRLRRPLTPALSQRERENPLLARMPDFIPAEPSPQPPRNTSARPLPLRA